MTGNLRFISAQDVENALKSRVTPDNEWIYCGRDNSLEHRETGYDVSLSTLNSSAAVLDWMFQVFGKKWCTAKTMRDLMVHIRERINPQAHFCSFGVERSK